MHKEKAVSLVIKITITPLYLVKRGFETSFALGSCMLVRSVKQLKSSTIVNLAVALTKYQ